MEGRHPGAEESTESSESALTCASGKLNNKNKPVFFSGTVGPEDAPHGGEPPECQTVACDKFRLDINLPNGTFNNPNKPGGVIIGLRFFNAANTLNVFVYKDNALVGQSAGIIATAQGVFLPEPSNGRYTIQWPATDEPDRLEQRHGRDDRSDGGGHQDHSGEEGGFDEVRATHHSRPDPRRTEPRHLGSPAPELAGEPGEQVGQCHSPTPTATRTASESARADGVASSSPATAAYVEGLPPAVLAELGDHAGRGVGRRAITTDLALATVPTDPERARPRSAASRARPTNGTAPTTPTIVTAWALPSMPWTSLA